MEEPFQEWVTRAPTVRLRPFVDRYIGYRLAGVAPRGITADCPHGT